MLEQVANIAEIIGVILVIVTLIFLTLQIRLNTRAVRSTTIQAIMQSDMMIAQLLLSNAALWDKILKGEMLEEGEQMRRAIILFNLLMIDAETRFHQFRSGYLDEQAWNARLGPLPQLLVLPLYTRWRESLGGNTHSADFLELIDSMHAEAN